MSDKYYISAYFEFDNIEARDSFMQEHVLDHTPVSKVGGPAFSYSPKDESGFRDERTKLIEVLRRARNTVYAFYADVMPHEDRLRNLEYIDTLLKEMDD